MQRPRRNPRLKAGTQVLVMTIRNEKDSVAASQALSPGGRLALIVHRENSPGEEFGIFSSLVARNPLVMTRRVAFDFPRDGAHLESLVDEAGLTVVNR